MQIGLLNTSQPDGVTGSTVSVCWTLANAGSQAWTHASIQLHSKCGLEAPQEVHLPCLLPGQTAEVGTEVLLGAVGKANLVYHVEVWDAEEGAITTLEYSTCVKPAPKPVPALAGQVVYVTNAADITCEQEESLLQECALQQVLAVSVENNVFEGILQNCGSQAWPAGCALQLVAGSPLNGTTRVDMSAVVAAGELVHVAFDALPGSRWVLCTPQNETFGCLIEVLPGSQSDEDVESEEWEKVGDADVEVAIGMCLVLDYLKDTGHADEALNAYLLQKYDMDVPKVERTLLAIEGDWHIE